MFIQRRFISVLRTTSNVELDSTLCQNYKSLFLVGTPVNVADAISEVLRVNNQFPSLQIVFATVDSILSKTNYLSQLWSDKPIEIGHFKPLDTKDRLEVYNDGVSAIRIKNNWELTSSTLSCTLGSHVAEISLANTIFQTQFMSTMFFLGTENDKRLAKWSGHRLTELHVMLPDISESSSLVYSDCLRPITGPLKVTKAVRNLIQNLDGKPAAHYLEKNENIKSTESKVYISIESDSGEVKRKFQVLAGGGWGVKGSMLAISPEIGDVQLGAIIKFHIYDPDCKVKTPREGIVLERSIEQNTYVSNEPHHPTLENIIGIGSEQGFTLNGVSHKSPGEQVVVV